MARCSRKLRMYSPKTLWLSSHSYRDGDAFNHTAAESSRKGVVGSSGRNIPVTPKANEMQPTMIKNILIAAQMYKLFVYL